MSRITAALNSKDTPFILRFIEYMDAGTTNGGRLGEVVPSAGVIACINAELPLEEVEPNYAGETSKRWRYRDGGGDVLHRRLT